jgi:hypothetical protein
MLDLHESCNAQELESRKRAPLYQKKQEEEAKAAAEKAKAAEERAADAEARCKEARVRGALPSPPVIPLLSCSPQPSPCGSRMPDLNRTRKLSSACV